MKKNISVLLSFVILFLFTATSCNNKNDNEKDNFTIVTSFYPIYIMALNIVDGIDNVELSCMADNNTGCLHDFQLQTKDMKTIEKADVFIINGAGMENFMNKITNEIPDLNIINSSKDITLIPARYAHSDVDGEYNGHIWVSIENYKIQVQNISNQLAELDPAHKSQYIENSKKYIEKLDKLQNDMHSALDNIKNRDIITFHEAFDYFADEFNLNVVLVIEREPGSEPSASELAETINLIKKTNTNAIFVEPQYPRTSADTISAETNVVVYTLDPCVTGDMNKDAYINTMRQNLQVLSEALN